MSETRKETEAVLLNSEGDPRDEVGEALQAAARFAFGEFGITEYGFLMMARMHFRAMLRDEGAQNESSCEVVATPPIPDAPPNFKSWAP